MNYYMYILLSLKDGNHYVGMTSDPLHRLVQHNKGLVRSTKRRTPFELLYKEVYATRIEARAREKYLKSYAGSKEKRDIIKVVHCRIV